MEKSRNGENREAQEWPENTLFWTPWKTPIFDPPPPGTPLPPPPPIRTSPLMQGGPPPPRVPPRPPPPSLLDPPGGVDQKEGPWVRKIIVF